MSNMNVEYQDIPGKGVVIGKRLQLPFDVAALKSMFGPVLEQTDLGQLLGELYHWITMPTTIASWVLAAALIRLPIWMSLLSAGIVLIVLKIVYQFVYAASINRVTRVMGQPLVLILLYAALGGWFVYAQDARKTMALAAWLLLDISGALEIVWNLVWAFILLLVKPLIRKLAILPEPQQVLFLIARSHAPHPSSPETEPK